MTTARNQDARRRVPRTDTVLADPRLADLRERTDPVLLKRRVQEALAEVRAGTVEPEAAVDRVVAGFTGSGSSLRTVINATGVVLHTNLGRAPLPPEAVQAITAAAGYVNVEYDIASGARARRGAGALAALVARTPRAEDALVVNNGAAALVLAAATLAPGKEIVISRGELVEIGDGFRIPELLEATGSRLREVGTTNRTHLRDYERALGPETGFILKIHPSNFAVRGFVASVDVRELADLGVPVVADIGSGLLEPEPHLPEEPDADSWLAAGADLVTASGDKLLGGPQAGLILGRHDLVQQLRRNPLARALRVDKLTLAALESTLTVRLTPTRAALTADAETLRRRAHEVAGRLIGIHTEVVPSVGLVGGGGAPERELAGWAIALPGDFAEPLRLGTTCVVARKVGDRTLLDLRCVPADSEDELVEAVLDASRAIDHPPERHPDEPH